VLLLCSSALLLHAPALADSPSQQHTFPFSADPRFSMDCHAWFSSAVPAILDFFIQEAGEDTVRTMKRTTQIAILESTPRSIQEYVSSCIRMRSADADGDILGRIGALALPWHCHAGDETLLRAADNMDQVCSIVQQALDANPQRMHPLLGRVLQASDSVDQVVGVLNEHVDHISPELQRELEAFNNSLADCFEEMGAPADDEAEEEDEEETVWADRIAVSLHELTTRFEFEFPYLQTICPKFVHPNGSALHMWRSRRAVRRVVNFFGTWASSMPDNTVVRAAVPVAEEPQNTTPPSRQPEPTLQEAYCLPVVKMLLENRSVSARNLPLHPATAWLEEDAPGVVALLRALHTAFGRPVFCIPGESLIKLRNREHVASALLAETLTEGSLRRFHECLRDEVGDSDVLFEWFNTRDYKLHETAVDAATFAALALRVFFPALGQQGVDDWILDAGQPVQRVLDHLRAHHTHLLEAFQNAAGPAIVSVIDDWRLGIKGEIQLSTTQGKCTLFAYPVIKARVNALIDMSSRILSFLRLADDVSSLPLTANPRVAVAKLPVARLRAMVSADYLRSVKDGLADLANDVAAQHGHVEVREFLTAWISAFSQYDKDVSEHVGPESPLRDVTLAVESLLRIVATLWIPIKPSLEDIQRLTIEYSIFPHLGCRKLVVPVECLHVPVDSIVVSSMWRAAKAPPMFPIGIPLTHRLSFGDAVDNTPHHGSLSSALSCGRSAHWRVQKSSADQQSFEPHEFRDEVTRRHIREINLDLGNQLGQVVLDGTNFSVRSSRLWISQAVFLPASPIVRQPRAQGEQPILCLGYVILLTHPAHRFATNVFRPLSFSESDLRSSDSLRSSASLTSVVHLENFDSESIDTLLHVLAESATAASARRVLIDRSASIHEDLLRMIFSVPSALLQLRSMSGLFKCLVREWCSAMHHSHMTARAEAMLGLTGEQLQRRLAAGVEMSTQPLKALPSSETHGVSADVPAMSSDSDRSTDHDSDDVETADAAEDVVHMLTVARFEPSVLFLVFSHAETLQAGELLRTAGIPVDVLSVDEDTLESVLGAVETMKHSRVFRFVRIEPTGLLQPAEWTRLLESIADSNVRLLLSASQQIAHAVGIASGTTVSGRGHHLKSLVSAAALRIFSERTRISLASLASPLGDACRSAARETTQKLFRDCTVADDMRSWTSVAQQLERLPAQVTFLISEQSDFVERELRAIALTESGQRNLVLFSPANDDMASVTSHPHFSRINTIVVLQAGLVRQADRRRMRSALSADQHLVFVAQHVQQSDLEGDIVVRRIDCPPETIAAHLLQLGLSRNLSAAAITADCRTQSAPGTPLLLGQPADPLARASSTSVKSPRTERRGDTFRRADSVQAWTEGASKRSLEPAAAGSIPLSSFGRKRACVVELMEVLTTLGMQCPDRAAWEDCVSVFLKENHSPALLRRTLRRALRKSVPHASEQIVGACLSTLSVLLQHVSGFAPTTPEGGPHGRLELESPLAHVSASSSGQKSASVTTRNVTSVAVRRCADISGGSVTADKFLAALVPTVAAVLMHCCSSSAPDSDDPSDLLTRKPREWHRFLPFSAFLRHVPVCSFVTGVRALQGWLRSLQAALDASKTIEHATRVRFADELQEEGAPSPLVAALEQLVGVLDGVTVDSQVGDAFELLSLWGSSVSAAVGEHPPALYPTPNRDVHKLPAAVEADVWELFQASSGAALDVSAARFVSSQDVFFRVLSLAVQPASVLLSADPRWLFSLSPTGHQHNILVMAARQLAGLSGRTKRTVRQLLAVLDWKLNLDPCLSQSRLDALGMLLDLHLPVGRGDERLGGELVKEDEPSGLLIQHPALFESAIAAVVPGRTIVLGQLIVEAVCNFSSASHALADATELQSVATKLHVSPDAVRLTPAACAYLVNRAVQAVCASYAADSNQLSENAGRLMQVCAQHAGLSNDAIEWWGGLLRQLDGVSLSMVGLVDRIQVTALREASVAWLQKKDFASHPVHHTVVLLLAERPPAELLDSVQSWSLQDTDAEANSNVDWLRLDIAPQAWRQRFAECLSDQHVPASAEARIQIVERLLAHVTAVGLRALVDSCPAENGAVLSVCRCFGSGVLHAQVSALSPEHVDIARGVIKRKRSELADAAYSSPWSASLFVQHVLFPFRIAAGLRSVLGSGQYQGSGRLSTAALEELFPGAIFPSMTAEAVTRAIAQLDEQPGASLCALVSRVCVTSGLSLKVLTRNLQFACIALVRLSRPSAASLSVPEQQMLVRVCKTVCSWMLCCGFSEASIAARLKENMAALMGQDVARAVNCSVEFMRDSLTVTADQTVSPQSAWNAAPVRMRCHVSMPGFYGGENAQSMAQMRDFLVMHLASMQKAGCVVDAAIVADALLPRDENRVQQLLSDFGEAAARFALESALFGPLAQGATAPVPPSRSLKSLFALMDILADCILQLNRDETTSAHAGMLLQGFCARVAANTTAGDAGIPTAQLSVRPALIHWCLTASLGLSTFEEVVAAHRALTDAAESARMTTSAEACAWLQQLDAFLSVSDAGSANAALNANARFAAVGTVSIAATLAAMVLSDPQSNSGLSGTGSSCMDALAWTCDEGEIINSPFAQIGSAHNEQISGPLEGSPPFVFVESFSLASTRGDASGTGDGGADGSDCANRDMLRELGHQAVQVSTKAGVEPISVDASRICAVQVLSDGAVQIALDTISMVWIACDARTQGLVCLPSDPAEEQSRFSYTNRPPASGLDVWAYLLGAPVGSVISFGSGLFMYHSGLSGKWHLGLAALGDVRTTPFFIHYQIAKTLQPHAMQPWRDLCALWLRLVFSAAAEQRILPVVGGESSTGRGQTSWSVDELRSLTKPDADLQLGGGLTAGVEDALIAHLNLMWGDSSRRPLAAAVQLSATRALQALLSDRPEEVREVLGDRSMFGSNVEMVHTWSMELAMWLSVFLNESRRRLADRLLEGAWPLSYLLMSAGESSQVTSCLNLRASGCTLPGVADLQNPAQMMLVGGVTVDSTQTDAFPHVIMQDVLAWRVNRRPPRWVPLVFAVGTSIARVPSRFQITEAENAAFLKALLECPLSADVKRELLMARAQGYDARKIQALFHTPPYQAERRDIALVVSLSLNVPRTEMQNNVKNAVARLLENPNWDDPTRPKWDQFTALVGRRDGFSVTFADPGCLQSMLSLCDVGFRVVFMQHQRGAVHKCVGVEMRETGCVDEQHAYGAILREVHAGATVVIVDASVVKELRDVPRQHGAIAGHFAPLIPNTMLKRCTELTKRHPWTSIVFVGVDPGDAAVECADRVRFALEAGIVDMDEWMRTCKTRHSLRVASDDEAELRQVPVPGTRDSALLASAEDVVQQLQQQHGGDEGLMARVRSSFDDVLFVARLIARPVTALVGTPGLGKSNKLREFMQQQDGMVKKALFDASSDVFQIVTLASEVDRACRRAAELDTDVIIGVDDAHYLKQSQLLPVLRVFRTNPRAHLVLVLNRIPLWLVRMLTDTFPVSSDHVRKHWIVSCRADVNVMASRVPEDTRLAARASLCVMRGVFGDDKLSFRSASELLNSRGDEAARYAWMRAVVPRQGDSLLSGLSGALQRVLEQTSLPATGVVGPGAPVASSAQERMIQQLWALVDCGNASVYEMLVLVGLSDWDAELMSYPEFSRQCQLASVGTDAGAAIHPRLSVYAWITAVLSAANGHALTRPRRESILRTLCRSEFGRLAEFGHEFPIASAGPFEALSWTRLLPDSQPCDVQSLLTAVDEREPINTSLIARAWRENPVPLSVDVETLLSRAPFLMQYLSLANLTDLVRQSRALAETFLLHGFPQNWARTHAAYVDVYNESSWRLLRDREYLSAARLEYCEGQSLELVFAFGGETDAAETVRVDVCQVLIWASDHGMLENRVALGAGSESQGLSRRALLEYQAIAISHLLRVLYRTTLWLLDTPGRESDVSKLWRGMFAPLLSLRTCTHWGDIDHARDDGEFIDEAMDSAGWSELSAPEVLRVVCGVVMLSDECTPSWCRSAQLLWAIKTSDQQPAAKLMQLLQWLRVDVGLIEMEFMRISSSKHESSNEGDEDDEYSDEEDENVEQRQRAVEYAKQVVGILHSTGVRDVLLRCASLPRSWQLVLYVLAAGDAERAGLLAQLPAVHQATKEMEEIRQMLISIPESIGSKAMRVVRGGLKRFGSAISKMFS
jgi:hypothetical protein